MRSLEHPDPPESCTPCLKALWYDKNENWSKAHQIAQEISTKDGFRIHAIFIERKEIEAMLHIGIAGQGVLYHKYLLVKNGNLW